MEKIMESAKNKIFQQVNIEFSCYATLIWMLIINIFYKLRLISLVLSIFFTIYSMLYIDLKKK